MCAVDFSHFKVLRAIGKGAFGKVSDGWCVCAVCVGVCLRAEMCGYAKTNNDMIIAS